MTEHFFQEAERRANTDVAFVPSYGEKVRYAEATLESILNDAEDLLARVNAIEEQLGLCPLAKEPAEQVVRVINEEVSYARRVRNDIERTQTKRA